MHPTAFATPIFPCGSGAVIYHIEITGIITFLQHLIKQIDFLVACHPFCEDRHTDKTDGNMPFVFLFRRGNHFLFHFIVQNIRNDTYQHRIRHIQLRTCSINSLISTIERLMNQLIQLFFAKSKRLCFFLFTQFESSLFHRRQTITDKTVTYQID